MRWTTFGSGLSSFSYLKHLSVDYLKIDGQFVREMEHDPVATEMVKAILAIGRITAVRTIAEGVENAALLEQLRVAGADYVAGLSRRSTRADKSWRHSAAATA